MFDQNTCENFYSDSMENLGAGLKKSNLETKLYYILLYYTSLVEAQFVKGIASPGSWIMPTCVIAMIYDH